MIESREEDREFVEREFTRMGFDRNFRWRISDINKDFELCNTYPRFLILPSDFKDEDLDSVAKFRYFRRIPTAVWRHIKNGCFIVRSSQPTVGWFGWFRNDMDENLVQSYVDNTIQQVKLINNDNGDQNNHDNSNQMNQDNHDFIENSVSPNSYLSKIWLTQETNNLEKYNSETIVGLSRDNSSQITNSDRSLKSVNAVGFISQQNQNEAYDKDDKANGVVNPLMRNHDNENSVGTNCNERITKSSYLCGSDKKNADFVKSTLPDDLDKHISKSEKETPSTASQLSTLNFDIDSKPTPMDNGSNLNQTSSSKLMNCSDNTIPIPASSSNTSTANTTLPVSTSKIFIIDARSYTAAMANRAKGGGCECSEYYQMCEVHFMNLANIHSIRKSYHAIRSVCETYSEQSNNWVSFLDNSRWLHHISGLLKSALLVVDSIDIERKSIMIHCSDGWDRTPQLVALAEVMLDPHYRTFEGFRTLIQREWLDFGHKFADRCGSNPCNEDPNERCPVFLQWLDCVQQLLVQYPRHFEFNSLYLDKLNRHTYSNVFGTFSYNSTQERILSKVNDQQPSLWSYFDSARRRYINENYVHQDDILRPSYKVKDLHFWKEVYLPPINQPKTPQASFMPITNNIDNNKCSQESLFIDGLTRTVCK